MNTKINSYTLDIGSLGSLRLEILNEVLNPYTLAFIFKNTSLEGLKVLEIASGVGELACSVAQRVGKTGSVLGVDYSEKFVQIASDKAEKNYLSHLSFKQLDIQNLLQLNEQYDVIYLRAILCHLKDVEHVLSNIYKSLKSGGILICEESAIESSFTCYPPNSTYNEWVYKLRSEMSKLHQTDFDIGCKLPSIGTKMGFKLKDAWMYQPFLTNPRHKKLISIVAQEVLPKLIEKGAYSQKEANHFLEKLNSFENDSSFFPSYLRIAQIAFQK